MSTDMETSAIRIKGRKLIPLYTEEQIRERVETVAAQLGARYRDRHPLIVCVLKGAFVFTADLVRHLDFPLQVDFVRISSYGSATSPSEVRLVLDLNTDVRGRDVIVVDDILDTGETLRFLLDRIEKGSPASVSTCVLVDKVERRAVAVEADYKGFVLEKGFVVGYGIDWAEEGRNLRALYTLPDEL